MDEVILPRRKFLIGSLAALFVAPAIIRTGVLMPVKSVVDAQIAQLDDFQMQFEDYRAKFLAEYRKSPSAEAAKAFDVNGFTSRYTRTAKHHTYEQLRKRSFITEFDT